MITAARLAQLAELSQTDTGLPNRRALLAQLAVLTSSARRHGRPLALVLLDLDRCKDVNDSHGHQAGDAVLREVGCRLAARVREEDVVGRSGGDEIPRRGRPARRRHGRRRAARRRRAAARAGRGHTT